MSREGWLRVLMLVAILMGVINIVRGIRYLTTFDATPLDRRRVEIDTLLVQEGELAEIISVLEVERLTKVLGLMQSMECEAREVLTEELEQLEMTLSLRQVELVRIRSSLKAERETIDLILGNKTFAKKRIIWGFFYIFLAGLYLYLSFFKREWLHGGDGNR